MLGENILTLRKKQGLSQEGLGELVKVTRQTISNWELGETTPNPDQLKLLSKALNISVDKLIGNETIQNDNILINQNMGYNVEQNNFIKFILFIVTSVIWGIACIVSFIEDNIMVGIINLLLCLVWGFISILWYYKKLKK